MALFRFAFIDCWAIITTKYLIVYLKCYLINLFFFLKKHCFRNYFQKEWFIFVKCQKLQKKKKTY